ncbi:MAG: M20 family metallopeptidase [Phycisphaerales bacterium]|nr:MAG: M20 family metallopeptidase [Phycisphaerales bacterium]
MMKQLLGALIEAETTAEKGELVAAEIISAELSRHGVDCQIDRWDGTRANVVARIGSTQQKSAILFVCHLDVVGPGEGDWKHPPFSAVDRNGRIYGRGSADMKGGVAATVTAICQIIDSGTKLQGDLVFLAAAGEETDSCGARRFVSNCGQIPRLAGVVIPEPTDFDIVTAHRGMLWLTITTKGKAAHSSTPELGVNAIASMKSVLDELEKYEIPFEPHELLGGCSMSINTISGGKAPNVVPDQCRIGIDIRTLPTQSTADVTADFERMLAELKRRSAKFDAEVSFVRRVEALETDNDCDFVKDFCSTVGVRQTKAVGFTTDGPQFVPLGAPILIFGPGKGHLCHKPDEYIDIADVERAVEHYKNVILRFLT